jgi:hypothetical protein
MAQPIPRAPSKFTSIRHIQPIRCPRCDEPARIIRRTPNAFERRDGSEIWTYQCDNCHITEFAGCPN